MHEKDRSESTHRDWGHTRRKLGSSPSHQARCKAGFLISKRNKIRRLERQVRKHPNDRQAAARLKDLR